MKEQFNQHSQRLSDEEKESIWRAIPKAPDLEKKRKIQFWVSLGGSTAAVALLIVMGIVYVQHPDKMTGFKELTVGPDAPTAQLKGDSSQALHGDEQTVAFAATESDATLDTKAPGTVGEMAQGFDRVEQNVAAAPVEPEEVPTVASSGTARRGSAAVPREEASPSKSRVRGEGRRSHRNRVDDPRPGRGRDEEGDRNLVGGRALDRIRGRTSGGYFSR